MWAVGPELSAMTGRMLGREAQAAGNEGPTSGVRVWTSSSGCPPPACAAGSQWRWSSSPTPASRSRGPVGVSGCRRLGRPTPCASW